MISTFVKPRLARYLQKQVGVYSAGFNVREITRPRIRAMREKYVTKLKLKKNDNSETEIVLGLGSMHNLELFTEKKKSEVTYNELMELLRVGSVTLVDVRNPNELEATGSMPQSINIPLNQLKTVLCSEDDEIASEVVNSEDPIVFIGLGNIKSVTALEIARKLGLKNVRHYPGGYQEWVNEAAKLITAENSNEI